MLRRLIDTLLVGMVYSEIDLILLGPQLDEDEMVPDASHDIRPRFHKAKVVGGSRPNKEDEAENKNKFSSKEMKSNDDEELDDDEDGEEEEEEEDDDDLDEEDDYDMHSPDWNLRKCSAAGLDMISNVFHDELLPILLPLLQQRLNEQVPWQVKESAILAIGAVAEGCSTGISEHLSALLPFLVSQLIDKQPLVRSISCWTLSRYTKWIVLSENLEAFLGPVLTALLQKVVDSNKRVQEAACSAFSTLEEAACDALSPHLPLILKTLSLAFQKYQTKNLIILYDVVGTLAESVGSGLQEGDNVETLLAPLIKKWNDLPDDDPTLSPLLECLTSVTIAVGPAFLPYAPPVIARCQRILEATLYAQAVATRDDSDPPEKDVMVCAIDLLSGLAEGLGAALPPLLSPAVAESLVAATCESAKDSDDDVRQTSFALIGDLAKAGVHNEILIRLDSLIPLILSNLNENVPPSISNNACWALGEIALRVGGEAVSRFVENSMKSLLDLLEVCRNSGGKSKHVLSDNVAITIGRLALCCPGAIAPHLESFLAEWCLALKALPENLEKASAFRGLCAVVRINPQAGGNRFIYFCYAIASWQQPHSDLQQMFFSILQGFKNSMSLDTWNQFFLSPQFPEDLRVSLQKKYHV
eukprot:TRINITY_DN1330_c0_g1_i2.p1 TRINITY_DN1330_c0_g1~~TRINITY_DN1330_c0_g1_i2.p1  ORF type:complete len:642 (+),score=180.61 TRINITY_DN1330_c0_g1_i2:981-2906(+)